jgi:hypothetical protein
MRRATQIRGAIAIALSVAALAGHAQKRPASEAEGLIYVESAFITQADPGLMKPNVVVGPELQKKLSVPAGTHGDKIYQAILDVVGEKAFTVRRATREELDHYGKRRGFDPALRQPLYVVAVENTRFLLQYDLQALQVSFIGELGTLDPEPIAIAAPPPIIIVTPVSFAWSTQFEYASSRLTKHSEVLLETAVLPKIKQLKEVRSLQLSGHADRVGPVQYNRRLSQKRAEALKEWLVEHGVDPDKIEIFSYGKTSPVASCPEEKNRKVFVECLAPNRRVVIELQGGVTWLSSPQARGH